MTSRIDIATRRSFLTRGLGVVGIAAGARAVVPDFLVRTALAGDRSVSDQKILVVLQLSGGHDGLSAIVPYGDDAYAKNRQASRIPESDVLKIDDYSGLHPNLTAFKNLLDAGHFAAVQAVGYPTPNQSHFTSMDIWHLADNEARSNSTAKESRFGWIGRYCDLACKDAPNPPMAISLGTGQTPRALNGRLSPGISFSQPQSFRYLGDRGNKERAEAYGKMHETTPTGRSHALDFVTRTAIDANAASSAIRDLAGKYKTAVTYPNGSLAASLKTVAALVAGGLSTRVYYVFQGGYDTHFIQKSRHDALMAELGASVGAFQQDLASQGDAPRVLTMTFSEFGRRVTENGSQGTDHGIAGPMFLVGPGVKPGLHGEPPSLEPDRLVAGRDLQHKIDFRGVYAAVLEKWLGCPSEPVLGGTFEPVDCIA
ncbi:MAG: DUF1501 domain-containing protein [Planctomycetes bacterium]|nr:DUF1501 domain-containing protein [Planctomycetota bacterium]